jgi:hybrid cluster-associated redox disulfide protein
LAQHQAHAEEAFMDGKNKADACFCESIAADYLIQEVIERHPQTIAIFARHGMQCAGCYISPFHTIADSAREHAMVLESLLSDLNQAIEAKAS